MSSSIYRYSKYPTLHNGSLGNTQMYIKKKCKQISSKNPQKSMSTKILVFLGKAWIPLEDTVLVWEVQDHSIK